MLKAKHEELNKKVAEIKVIEKDFVNEWNENGFAVIKGTDNLTRKDFKINKIMVSFILKWIPKMNNEHSSQERLVRSLARSNITINGELLIALFDDPNSSFFLKWAIGNTIATAQVNGVNEWLKEKFMALTLGQENEMLVYAVAKYLDYPDAVEILRKVSDSYPFHVADMLSKIGKKEDLNFLKSKIKDFKGAQKASIAKAIKKLSQKHPD